MKPTLRLLYAEDNPQDADMTRACFAEHAPEFELQIVSTGAACLGQILANPPDLLLLDHHLPDTESVTLLPALLRQIPGLPVVIVTGVGDEALVVRLLRMGAAHYVPKHGNYLETLPELLHDVLAEHRNKLSQGLPASNAPQRILYVEHLPMDIDLTLRHFAEAAPNFTVDVAHTCADALARLSLPHAYDLVLIDLRMPDQNGLDFFSEAKYRVPHLPPCILISGSGDEATAMAALKLGAADYLIKREGYLNQLVERIANAITQARLSRLNAQLVVELTERKQVDEAIINAKKDWERTFDSVPDLISIIDTNHTITRVNKAMAERCGHAPEEMIGLKCHEVMHGMSDPPVFCPHVSMMQDGLVHNKEIDEKRLNGSFDILVVPLYDTEGQITACVHVARDITERKKAEEEKQTLEQQFQQAHKLESLGVLAGGIAHDFNNILTIIICNCSLLQQRPAMAAELVPEIEVAAQRAADLCRQMLIYAGKAQPNPTKFNIKTLVEEMVKMLKATINQNVTITLDLSEDIPSIKADASQIRQVVMNLIINASEAIGTEQGHVTMTLAIVRIEAEPSEKDYLGKVITPGSYICLNVTDNGCGMDEGTKQRIFEPFYTTKFTGRGLGMSAVLGIIKAHNGALQLTSQQGFGTTFKVYLPVQGNEPAGDLLPHVTVMPWQGSGTILLVEDEPQLIMVAKALLQALGFSVFVAENGQAALEMYQKNAEYITLVLTDIGMPVMDGYELIRELKKLNPELPIIVSSGFGDAEVTSRIHETIAGCVSKPYSFDQLREVLKRVVEGTKSAKA